MPDLHGNLTRGDGKTPLEGRVWLGQERGKWPVHVLQHESEVIRFLGTDRGNVVWEYELTPVERVQAVNPEPFLTEYEYDGRHPDACRCQFCREDIAEAERDVPEDADDTCPLCLAPLNRDGSCFVDCAGVGDG